ncbi:MAG: hypothetical protein AAF571_10500 [Verrucomicrobiota bacterium]
MPKKSATKPKRFIAVSCSHGHLADPNLLAQVCDFAAKFKAERRIHLGDWCDLAAMRNGAGGTNDEAESITQDLKAGFQFLADYQATDIFFGNHEIRVFRFLHSHNAVKSYAAGQLLGQFQEFSRQLGARTYMDYHIQRPSCRLVLGDTMFLHGFMFNETATRDHAEWAQMQVVHGHTHRPDISKARTLGSHLGYSVGALCNTPNMDYPAARRQTSAWGAAVAYGEFTNKECKVWMEIEKNGKFQFPI